MTPYGGSLLRRLVEDDLETSVHPRIPARGDFLWTSLVQRPSSWCQGDWVGGRISPPARTTAECSRPSPRRLWLRWPHNCKPKQRKAPAFAGASDSTVLEDREEAESPGSASAMAGAAEPRVDSAAARSRGRALRRDHFHTEVGAVQHVSPGIQHTALGIQDRLVEVEAVRVERHGANARAVTMPTTGRAARKKWRLRLLLKEAYWKIRRPKPWAATML